MNILVAEDNMFTAQQYNKILEKNGHSVTLAKDGEECIQKFEQKLSEFDSIEKPPFDVILLDNNMPKKNGAEVAKMILEKTPQQRIIFASAYDIDALLKVPKNLKQSLEVLQKPFSLTSMLAKLERN